MKKKILVIDDEVRMRILLKDFLIKEGYQVVEAENGQVGIDLFFEHNDFGLVLLDVMMPVMDGWSVCEILRKESNIPIIFLTAMSTEEHEIKGFQKGCDEYIKKPFSPSILMHRIQAIFRRTYGGLDLVSRGILSFDSENSRVFENGVDLELSSTEYHLLSYMAENDHMVLSREQLLNGVWGYTYDGTDRTIDTHINRLRMKMKTSGHYIKTMRGLGYKFEVGQ